MTGKLKAAFDGIRAGNALKEHTLECLRAEIRAGGKPQTRLSVKRFAAAFACLLCAVFAGLIYFTETAYIDFDVNPSVALAVNRFDRVVGVYAYNSAGEDILKSLNLAHKTYPDAIDAMLGMLLQKGHLRDDGLVSVTLQTNDSAREPEMLAALSAYVETGVSGHHCRAQVDVFPVSGSVRDDAYALDLSPAKYLAILDLQEVDPEATVEGCRGHTIGELKSMTESHGGGHHTENGGMMRGGNMGHGGRGRHG